MLICKNAVLLFLLMLCCSGNGIAQKKPQPKKKAVATKSKSSITKKKYGNAGPQINGSFNRIFNGSLASFYDKLATIKSSDSAVVRIVHIGDSHIQADFLSSVVRNGMQQSFGNAGRGLVFPYQVARSNAPADIFSSSQSSWQSNRLAHPERGKGSGISGFYIQTARQGSSLELGLKPSENGEQYFQRAILFTDTIMGSTWSVQAQDDTIHYLVNDSLKTGFHKEIQLKNPATRCIISCLSGDSMRCFYGASLENNQPGILYHSIGVNGARFDQYNATPLFWKQLPVLEADLYIVSLGTNEAQAGFFDANAFESHVSTFIEKLKAASPNATILLTTAADSYKGKKSNLVLKQLNNFLSGYSERNHIPLWDLYRVTNGYGAARQWLRKGWLNKDRIHFTPEGYKVQGNLLLTALRQGYENYNSAN